MAFNLTAKTRSLLNQIEKRPSIALDIEGLSNLYSSTAILKLITWDNEDGITWDLDGAKWDSSFKDSSASDLIDARGSTKTITQQIYPDKEGSSSITSATIKIIDKNGAESKKFALNSITEILGKKCTLSIGFQGGTYPQDYMPVMNAIVVDYSFQGGSIFITLSHADSLRRQSILTEYASALTASIDDIQTSIQVESTEDLLPGLESLSTYIKIEDEIMEVVSIDSPTQLTVIRSELNTIAASHDNDQEVTSIYRIQGNALDLTQKIMQSDGSQTFFESDIPIVSITYVDLLTEISNAIIFDDFDIKLNSGLIQGDTINLDSYGDLTVESFGILDTGYSYIVVQEDLPTIVDASSETWRFRSKYNVLNFGLGMLPFEVDNEEFELTKVYIGANLTDLDFRLEEGITNTREFINKELLFISGCYSIPRNARSSIRALLPPLSIEELPTLNETNILNSIDLRPMRSVNKFYYNDILFAYNKSIKDGKFKAFAQTIDSDSLNTVNVGNKQLRIESEGYIRNTETNLIINRLAQRYLSRYKGAATLIKKISLPFRTGFNIQVGDIVFIGSENLKLVDYETGDRSLPLDKYEVINQSISLDGVVTLDCLSTGFSVTGTFAVISPSSRVDSGSSDTKLILSSISNLNEFEFERDKYENLIGARIRVRSDDFSYDETTVIEELDPQSNNSILVSALPSAPPANALIELDLYDNYAPFQDNDLDTFIKLKYTYLMDQAEINAVTSSSIFNIDDTTRFFEGQRIAVHSQDFTRDQQEATIKMITGNTIELEEALDFTPVIGDSVESLAFTDLDGYLFL